MPRPSKPGSFQEEVLEILCASDRPRTLTTLTRRLTGWKAQREVVNNALHALKVHGYINRIVHDDIELFQATHKGKKYDGQRQENRNAATG